MKLVCAIVGEAGGAFELDIDEVASVSTLKDTVKETIRNKLKGVAAADLQLFLAKRNKKNDTNEQEEEKGDEEEKWQTQDEAQKSVRDTSGYTFLARSYEMLGWLVINLAKQTFTGKRTRGIDWFVDDEISKKRKVNGGDIQYFNMDKFPLMAHSMEKFKEIMERDAYRVIFADLMRRVKKSMKIPSSANLIVTGNSGTGKSRFYLYCIFQLLLGNGKEVKELPAFDLVLNFDNDYQLYDAETKEFVTLNEEEVSTLRQQDLVLRLVDGTSSHLVGWKGVSILFASSGLDGMDDYTNAGSHTYILPVWSFEELQDYNSLLNDQFKLAEDVLISRYNKFGGIPRFIFTDSELGNDLQLRKAIHTFSRWISFQKSKRIMLGKTKMTTTAS